MHTLKTSISTLLLAATLAACAEPESPLSPQSAVTPATPVTTPSPRQLDRMSGDYTVTIHGDPLQPSGKKASEPSITRTTHVQRARQRNGRWRTTLTWKPDSVKVASAAGASAVSLNPIVRAEIDETTQEIQLFDGRGKRVSLPEKQKLQRHIDRVRSAHPDIPQRSQLTQSLARTIPRESGTSQTAGIDPHAPGFLISPQQRATFSKNLKSRYQLASGRIDGKLRYLAVQGDTTLEALVDSTIGLPAEMNMAIKGELQTQTQFRYLKVGEGHDSTYMRTHVISRRKIPGQEQPLVIQGVWSNLQFGGRR